MAERVVRGEREPVLNWKTYSYPSDDLTFRVLQTYQDVMRYYIFKRLILKAKGSKEPAGREISYNATKKIEEIWLHASILSFDPENP